MNIYILIPLLMFFNSLISIVCLAISNAIDRKINMDCWDNDFTELQLVIISIPIINLILIFVLGLMLFSYLCKKG